MKRYLTTLLAAVLLAGTASAKEFTYSSWTPPTDTTNKALGPYFEKVKADTGGEFTYKYFVGGQLFGAAATLGGVRDGAVDGGFVAATFTPKDLPINVMLMDMQAATRDPLSAVAAVNQTIMVDCPECQEEYGRNKSVTLGGHATTAYYFLCKSPVNSLADLKGKKIRSVSRYMSVLTNAVGGTPVTVPPSEMVQAMQLGRLDCALAPREWLVTFGLKDEVKYIVEQPSFGVIVGVSMLCVNANTWKGLSPKVKQAMIRNMPMAVAGGAFGAMEGDQRVVDTVIKANVKSVKLGADMEAIWKKVQEEEPTAVIDAATKNGAKNAQAIVDTYRKNLKKWEAIVDQIGPDRAKFEQALWDEIYSKVKL